MKAIDADTHVFEPIELFHEHLDPQLRDRGPEWVEQDDKFCVRVGETIYPTVPHHPGIGHIYGPKSKIDTTISGDPVARLQYMDSINTYSQVIFPTLGMAGFSAIGDPELGAGCARAYNRYISEFTSLDPVRLKATMLIPFNHPELAVKEMEFALENFGLDVAFSNPVPPTNGGVETAWSDEQYDPIWAVAAANDVTIIFHESTVGCPTNAIGINRYTWRWPMLYLCTHTVEPQLITMDLILGGVLHRHPGLKVGLAEAHVAWLAGWLQVMDDNFGQGVKIFGNESGEAELDLLPSEYFKRQMFIVGFSDDGGVAEAVEALGADNVLLSSDWPHPNERQSWTEEVAGRDDLTAELKTHLMEDAPKKWIKF